MGEFAVEVATGQEHALIRTSKNRLVSRRKDPDDKLLIPPPEVLAAKVAAVSAYQRLAMALTEDGHAYTWGVGSSTQGGPLLISEPEVSAIAAGHYAFLAKSDSPRYLAGDRPNGDPADVNEIFPGESAVKGKPYVLKRVDFGVPALRLSGGGASPTVLALAPATDAELSLQEGYAFPAEVRSGSDLNFQWRIDNNGPTKATGVLVTVQLPAKVTLHPKHRDAVEKGAIEDLGGGKYRFKTADLEPADDGWTVPLITRVGGDAGGRLTATAEVTAANIADPAPALESWAQVTAEGAKWDSSDDDDLWKRIGDALVGGLFALFKLIGSPGGGNSSQPKQNKKPKRNKNK
ncbi:hypothetical protein [Embleya sp. NPDC001921]